MNAQLGECLERIRREATVLHGGNSREIGSGCHCGTTLREGSKNAAQVYVKVANAMASEPTSLTNLARRRY